MSLRRLRWPLLLGLAVGCATAPEAPRCGEVLVDDRAEPRWVALAGQSSLQVTVAGGTRPVSGSMREGPRGPAFHPTFPFTPGLSYVVESGECTASFTVPEVAATAPRVVSVLPSTPELPENVLRFYVTFSRPMAEGDFLSHLRLERVDTGEELTGVFFDNIHELWSADRTRITLLVDPGRVKTGLRAHDERGRAFEAGGTYRLRVRPTWRSLQGQPLSAEFVHDFGASAEDREPVDPGTWSLQLPPAGGRDPLRVDFGEAVDHVSVHRLLWVTSPDGTPLRGVWKLGSEERTASWTPSEPWSGDVGEHALVVNGRFEDIAGNNLNAAMDHPMEDRPPPDEGRPVTRRLGTPAVHRLGSPDR
ncbi:MAG: hypothetical protein AAF602_12880 [Myxococcota bacterium]